ncbi:hypothetical protein B7Z28_00760 [Candidatus Saccharibacteria bacterium 32-45-3]|nr:MAG: hypothetical protein B7Z28_00760 [Candidatus Saccharibacteria bacterium 32-45-3]
MADQDEQYPGYNFASHVGYGTATHRQAIEQLGITPLHRVSFKPLQKYSSPKKSAIRDISINFTGKTTKTIGDEAEDVASQYLVANGHVLLERNWRTKFCEIDIVSQHESTVYFTEVKYRSSKDQGGGIAAITPKKLRQMKFAAELFALKHSLSDINLRLSVIEMSNQPPSVESYLKIE